MVPQSTTKVAVIGAGPAGLAFCSKLSSLLPGGGASIQLLNDGPIACSGLAHRTSRFVRNFKTDITSQLAYLLDGTWRGTQLSKHLPQLFAFPVTDFPVSRITRFENGNKLVISDKLSRTIEAQHLFLATGLRNRRLLISSPIGISPRFDITMCPTECVPFHDFPHTKIVIIGNGDNAVRVAANLGERLESISIATDTSPLILLAKNREWQRNLNPEFVARATHAQRIGLLRVMTGFGEAQKLVVSRAGLVTTVIGRGCEYRIPARNGAYVATWIGYEPNLPDVNLELLASIPLLGDLAMAKARANCNLCAAIEQAETAAIQFAATLC